MLLSNSFERIIFILFGLCPTSCNTRSVKCLSSNIIFIYAILYDLLTPFVIWKMHLANIEIRIENALSDAVAVRMIFERILLIGIFHVCLLAVIYKIKYYKMLINGLSNVTVKLKESYKIEFKKRSFKGIFLILILHGIIVSNGYWLIFGIQFSIDTLIFEIIFEYAVLNSVLVVMYIIEFGRLINERFDKLHEITCIVGSKDLSEQKNVREFLNLLQLHVDLSDLKDIFNDTFGFQLLMTCCFDFILLTGELSNLITTIYGQRFTITTSTILFISIYLLPHLLKCLSLVKEMNKLANQVSN